MLVNNAGISSAPGSRFRSPVDEIAENIRAVYETNVFGVVRVTNAFMPLLRESEASRIVNLTSKRGSIGEEGAWVGRPYMSYSTSKTALNAITVHYARSLEGTSIKVNGAAPGHVATDFNGFTGKRTPEEGAAGSTVGSTGQRWTDRNGLRRRSPTLMVIFPLSGADASRMALVLH